MQAISKYVAFEVCPADDVIRSVIPEAVYICKFDSFTLAFVKSKKGEYSIENEMYTIIGTNAYEQL